MIQLARLHICVRQVPTARPGVSECSGNVVAYPLECHALLRHLGTKAEDLPNWITVLFEGDDRSVVCRELNTFLLPFASFGLNDKAFI